MSGEWASEVVWVFASATETLPDGGPCRGSDPWLQSLEVEEEVEECVVVVVVGQQFTALFMVANEHRAVCLGFSGMRCAEKGRILVHFGLALSLESGMETWRVGGCSLLLAWAPFCSPFFCSARHLGDPCSAKWHSFVSGPFLNTAAVRFGGNTVECSYGE